MKKHFVDLQSLRGLAALVVLMHHCTAYYMHPYRKWSEFLLNAHAAVVLFFVLSGYVLSLSLSKEPITWLTAFKFYLRRAFRIYPALFAACVLALIADLVVVGRPIPPTVSDWVVNVLPGDHLSYLKIVASFIGFGTYLPLPTWTLFIEWVGSLAMPVFVLICARNRGSALLLIGVLAIFSFTYGMNTRVHSGQYLVDFALGISITNFSSIYLWLGRNVLRARATAIAVCSVLMFGRLAGPWRFDQHYHDPIPALAEGIAAMIFVGVIVYGAYPIHFLRHKSLVFLGDISYSLYLIHFPVFVLVAALGGVIFKLPLFTANTTLATVSLVGFTALITIPLAALSYRFVELPGIELGKKAVGVWFGKKETPALAASTVSTGSAE